MRIAILFLTCLIVVNTVYCTRKSKTSTSKGRGGNSRVKGATTVLKKPKSGAGIPVSRKKRSVPPEEPFSEVPKSTGVKSKASTSKGRAGNSRTRRAATRSYDVLDTELQKPKSGAGIPVSRKKRSVQPEEPFSEVPKPTDDKSQASTSKGRGGNSKMKRAATELQIPETSDGTSLRRKRRSVSPDEPFSEAAQTSDVSNTQKEKNGKTDNKGKMKPRIAIFPNIKMRDTTN
ncbi:hypothetical protein RUM43_004027 [Polyplax serrata]|uniref:Uncharacterized protein n=1 Tax=Polyplax serrata TaxID=468196 RepID=A0AAN8SAG2_POLSC